MTERFMDGKPVAVIGGGSAGLAAAIAAKREGAERVLLLEKENVPGGILGQCIHDGFGLVRFGESLTGPEYARRFIEEARSAGIDTVTGATVVRLTRDRIVSFVHRDGCSRVRAGAVVLATGCRERTRGELRIPGPRPAGIFTAGTVQNLVNLKNVRVGDRAVILGSGDIGLIVARRLTLEGVDVKAVVERLPRPGGLIRNVVRCIDDFGIPLLLSSTVTAIRGSGRVAGVTVSRLDETGAAVPGTERDVPCDTLILSVGLIPENSLAAEAGVELDPVTGGPVVDGLLETSVPGVFACGNCLHVHDLVDYASAEAELAGRSAARFASEDGRGETPPRGESVTARSAIVGSSPAVPGTTSTSGADGPVRENGNTVVCTLCPNGCAIRIGRDAAGSVTYGGAFCPKGKEYAEAETTGPLRTLTTTVRVTGGVSPLVSVRSSRPIPRALLMPLVASLRSAAVDAPVDAGRIVLENLGGTGADLVATARVDRRPG